jgi:hypothetical protein
VLSPATSKIFPGFISDGRLLNISALLGFRVGTFPFTYPRYPFFVGQPEVLYLQAIVDKIKA